MFIFERAFRPFFFGAMLFSIMTMLAWWWQYPNFAQPYSGVPAIYWHAHEMVFGYTLAVIAGFLLTAVVNWSRIAFATGFSLALVFLLWFLARLGYLLNLPLPVVALFDLSFNLGLLWLFVWPVWRARLYKQLGLVGLFGVVFIANTWFYASVYHQQPGQYQALMLGMFAVLSVNLIMMQRLIPFFTQKSLNLKIASQPKLDLSIMLGFIALAVAYIWYPFTLLNTLIAWPLAIVMAYRQWVWYRQGIWRQILLWPLHLAHGFFVLGVSLFGLVGLHWIAPTTALHALAAGGIGLLCTAMIARISLAHTGRNIYRPPAGLVWVFVLLIAAAIFRVVMPHVLPGQLALWIHLAQLGWVAGFSLLFVLFWSILNQPNLDHEQNDFKVISKHEDA